LRQHVGPETRMKEKIEDMAIALAPNSTTALSIEPEDVPVIPVSSEEAKVEDVRELVKPGEVIVEQESAPKRRGRPKKVAVEA